jgi:hypothetical protein
LEPAGAGAVGGGAAAARPADQRGGRHGQPRAFSTIALVGSSTTTRCAPGPRSAAARIDDELQRVARRAHLPRQPPVRARRRHAPRARLGRRRRTRAADREHHDKSRDTRAIGQFYNTTRDGSRCAPIDFEALSPLVSRDRLSARLANPLEIPNPIARR